MVWAVMREYPEPGWAMKVTQIGRPRGRLRSRRPVRVAGTGLLERSGLSIPGVPGRMRGGLWWIVQATLLPMPPKTDDIFLFQEKKSFLENWVSGVDSESTLIHPGGYPRLGEGEEGRGE